MFTSFLISSMLEYGGSRHIRFRDLAVAVYGARFACMMHCAQGLHTLLEPLACSRSCPACMCSSLSDHFTIRC